MADLFYGTASYDRTRGNFPVFPVINMFVEQSPTESQPVLVSRPGIGLLPTPNLGFTGSPVKAHGAFGMKGLMSDDVFFVTADNKLYRVNPTGGPPYTADSTSLLGSINGSGPVSWGAYSDRIYINSGQSVYKYDGALTTVAMPGGFNVTSICVAASRLVVIDDSTGKFYWSDPLSDTVDALSFATAENSPDNLFDLLYYGDVLLLFGAETVEQWPITEDPDTPFQPLVGRAMTAGIRATGCATLFNKSFAWITNHNNICVGDDKTVISQPWLEEKLALSSAASLWTFWLEGQEFLAVRLDNNTYVLSSKSLQWSEFNTNTGSNWIVNSYSLGVFGSGSSDVMYQWKTEANASGPYTDDSGSTFERRFRLGSPVTTGNLIVKNLTLRVNEGYTPAYSGGRPTEWQTPTINLRTSRDGGNNWSAYIPLSLGANGSYKIPPTWRSLGMFGYPGFLAEVQITDRVPFRVSGAQLNENYGTRS